MNVDLEDAVFILAQCAIPVFDGLLDEPYNSLFMDLLFSAAEWHALAKLRLHSSRTVEDLRNVTTALTDTLRRFEKETSSIVTTELPKETRTRQRRTEGNPQAAAASSTPQIRRFNLSTYKLHVLPDYAPMIERFGTTDSWTSRLVSPYHDAL